MRTCVNAATDGRSSDAGTGQVHMKPFESHAELAGAASPISSLRD